MGQFLENCRATKNIRVFSLPDTIIYTTKNKNQDNNLYIQWKFLLNTNYDIYNTILYSNSAEPVGFYKSLKLGDLVKKNGTKFVQNLYTGVYTRKHLQSVKD